VADGAGALLDALPELGALLLDEGRGDAAALRGPDEGIEDLDKEGLRPRIKVMVGGAPITRDWATKIKADGYSEDAVGAVKLAKDLVGKA